MGVTAILTAEREQEYIILGIPLAVAPSESEQLCGMLEA